MRVSHYPWRWTVPICSSQRDLALHSSDQPDFVNSKDSSQAKGSVSHIGWYRLWWLALNERWRSVLPELEFLINSNRWIFQLTSFHNLPWQWFLFSMHLSVFVSYFSLPSCNSNGKSPRHHVTAVPYHCSFLGSHYCSFVTKCSSMVSAYNRVMCAESASIQLAVHVFCRKRLSGNGLKLLLCISPRRKCLVLKPPQCVRKPM